MSSQSTALRPAAVLAASSWRERLAVPLALLAVYVIWGSTYLAIRIAVRTIPPYLMAGTRFFVAGCLLYIVLRARGVPSPTLRQWGAAGIVGLLLLVLANGTVGVAEQFVASGLAAVLIATVPLWAALFARIWGHRPTPWEIAGLIIGFSGIILLNVGTSLHAHPLGAVILILAAIAWAFGSVWSPHLPLPPGVMGSAAEMIVGGGLMLLIALARGEHLSHTPDAASLWAVAYLIGFGSLVGYVAYTYLLANVRPVLATSYAYVNPVVAVALGVALVGESITPLGIVALLVVLLAVGLVVTGRARR